MLHACALPQLFGKHGRDVVSCKLRAKIPRLTVAIEDAEEGAVLDTLVLPEIFEALVRVLVGLI